MDFKEATDSITNPVGLNEVAKAMDASVQAVKQARLSPETHGHRAPPPNWPAAIIRLAEDRVAHYRKLIERLRKAR